MHVFSHMHTFTPRGCGVNCTATLSLTSSQIFKLEWRLATVQDTFDERKLSRQEDNSDKKVLEQEVVSIIKDIDVIDLAVEKIPVLWFWWGGKRWGKRWKPCPEGRKDVYDRLDNCTRQLKSKFDTQNRHITDSQMNLRKSECKELA